MKSINISFSEDKIDFVNNFKKDVKPNQFLFFDFFDSKPKRYYGHITNLEFKIRSGQEPLFARAHGIINEDNSEIKICVLGYNWFSLLWLLIMISVFCAALIDFLKNEDYGVFSFLILVLILILLFYYKLKSGIKSFIKTLEIDLKRYEENN